MIRNVIFALFAVNSLAATTRAEFIMSIEQSGSDVIATGSGTLNLSALTMGQVGGGIAAVWGVNGVAAAGFNSNNVATNYSGITGPSNFGNGSFIYATSGSGNLVGVNGSTGIVFVDVGYVFGNALSDSATWDNTTISGLGLTPGTYTWTWGTGPTADSFEVNIASVPEPSSLILLALSIGVVAFGAWLRRRRAAVEPAV